MGWVMAFRVAAARLFFVWLFTLSVLSLGWPDPASAAETEIGEWRCISAASGSCPPDGRGRGPADFWTLPTIENSRKISVSCFMTDTGWTERCLGLFHGWLVGQVIGQWGGGRLDCPVGYVRRMGECVEAEKPRSDRNCPAPAGSPIDAATGENRQAVTDMRVAGATPQGTRSPAATAAAARSLELNRYYSSKPVGPIVSGKSRLGRGWKTSFDAEAVWDGALASTRLIHFQLPDFEEHSFALIDGAWKLVLPRANGTIWDRLRTDGAASLQASGSGMSLRLADGTRYAFNDKGQLTQVAYADGYTQTLTYTGDLNTRVTDSNGQWLNFIYRPAGSWKGLLVTVQASDGRLIRYDYEDRSQAGLAYKSISTTGASQMALKAVTYNTPSASGAYSPRTEYEYLDNMYRPYLVTKVTYKAAADPSTWFKTNWTYDTKKRVRSISWNGGKDVWKYTYDDLANEVTVTDPKGVVTSYSRRQGSDGLWRLFKPKNSLSKLLGANDGEVQLCGDVINICIFVGSSIASDGSNFCVYKCRTSGVTSIFTFGRCPGFIREG